MTDNNLYCIRRAAEAALRQAGIENPAREARLIVKTLMRLSDGDLIADETRPVEPSVAMAIQEWTGRRIKGEPLSRIAGEREFWGLPFTVTPDVLDPRPDTETIIEVALATLTDRPPSRILDLGTGSGCLLVSLLHVFPGATGLGIDLSPAALNVALGNATRNGVAARATFRQGNWGDGLDEQFGLIVSNPPYIRNADIPNLEFSVRDFDPILALAGGEGGLDAYIKLVDDVRTLLAPRGIALLEVGQGQADDVMRLGRNAGFTAVESHNDIAEIARVVAWRFGDK